MDEPDDGHYELLERTSLGVLQTLHDIFEGNPSDIANVLVEALARLATGAKAGQENEALEKMIDCQREMLTIFLSAKHKGKH